MGTSDFTWGRYFNSLIKIVSKRHKTDIANHMAVLKNMYNTTFKAYIAMDENRIDDAYSFRRQYCIDNNIPFIGEVADQAPSILEVLIALSVRLERDCFGYGEDQHPEHWFWDIMRNLGLIDITDAHYSEVVVDVILTKFLTRDYAPDGNGGAFPLKKPFSDQTKVDLWKQAQSYALEHSK